MRKYVKPELFYEHYELSKHIADCAWELTHSNKEECSAVADPDYISEYSGMNLFMDSSNGCVLIPGVNYDAYCYHGGSGGPNVFAS